MGCNTLEVSSEGVGCIVAPERLSFCFVLWPHSHHTMQLFAALTSFDVSMESVWMLRKPAIAYHTNVVITVMRASAHVSDPLGDRGRGITGYMGKASYNTGGIIG